MIQKLHSTTTGTVSLDIRETGVLTQLVLTCQIPTASQAQIEVSFNSTAQFSTNDATGVLATMNLGPSIGNAGHVSITLEEPVDAGERIYLHTSASAVSTALLVTRPSAPAASRPVARRR